MKKILEYFNKRKIQKKYAITRSEDEIKIITNILIIDDQKFEIEKSLIAEGWNVNYVKDLDSFENPKLKAAHIVCIDIMGVGKKLNIKNEGMGLVRYINEMYPEKKIILYSSQKEQNIFDDAE